MNEVMPKYGGEHAEIREVLEASLEHSLEAVTIAKRGDQDPNTYDLIPWKLMSEIDKEVKQARAAIASGHPATSVSHTLHAAVLAGRLMASIGSSH